MLPAIAKLVSLDIYRDGGSVSASFLGTDGIKYCLLFPIDSRRDQQRRGFKPPLLESRRPTEYTSKITGEKLADFVKESAHISWEDASALLGQLAPFAASASLFTKMVQLAAHEGSPVDS